MIRVVLVGATGSIGRSALDVLRALGPDVELLGAFAGSRAKDLADLARSWSVEYVGVADPATLPALRERLPENARTGAGNEWLAEAMEARGFGRPGPTRAPRPGWTFIDRLAVLGAGAVLLAGAIWL